jgi:hypothetical protein
MKMMKATFLILAMSGILFNCSKEKKDDSTQNLLLLFLLDQSSGNCSTIVKTTSGTSSTYTATGNGVPKGGCTSASLAPTYVTDSSAAKTASDASYDKLLAVTASPVSNCSTYATTISNLKSNTTASTISAAATASSTGCTTVGLDGRTVYCTTSANATTNQALTQYSVVSSVATDMSTNITSKRKIAKLDVSSTGFTSTNIDASTLTTAAELAVISSAAYLDWFFATILGQSSCALAIMTSNSASIKSVVGKLNGGSVSSSSGITTTDAASIVPIINGSCRYGTNVTATTEVIGSSSLTSVAAVGLCPSTYTSF